MGRAFCIYIWVGSESLVEFEDAFAASSWEAGCFKDRLGYEVGGVRIVYLGIKTAGGDGVILTGIGRIVIWEESLAVVVGK